MKARIVEAASAEGLSVREWVQAIAAGHTGDVTEAHKRGHDGAYAAGRKPWAADGYRRGEKKGMGGGFVAGLLEAHSREAKGQRIDPDGLARHLLERAEQQAIAEAVLHKLLRKAQQGW